MRTYFQEIIRQQKQFASDAHVPAQKIQEKRKTNQQIKILP